MPAHLDELISNEALVFLSLLFMNFVHLFFLRRSLCTRPPTAAAIANYQMV